MVDQSPCPVMTIHRCSICPDCCYTTSCTRPRPMRHRPLLSETQLLIVLKPHPDLIYICSCNISRHTLQFGAVKLLRRASNSHTLYVRSLVLFVAVILFARIVLLAAIHHMIAMIPLPAKVQIATITLLHSHACCRVGSCHISGVCATH